MKKVCEGNLVPHRLQFSKWLQTT